MLSNSLSLSTKLRKDPREIKFKSDVKSGSVIRDRKPLKEGCKRKSVSSLKKRQFLTNVLLVKKKDGCNNPVNLKLNQFIPYKLFQNRKSNFNKRYFEEGQL